MAKNPMQFKYEGVLRTIFDETQKEKGIKLSEKTAWQFLYRALLWLEKIGNEEVPHIREVNDLKKRIWLDRGKRLAAFLNSNLEPTADPLSNRVGLLYEASNARKEQQKQNIVGTGFEYSLSILIKQFCSVAPLVKPKLNQLQGFELAPLRFVQQPDLALFDSQDFRILVSSKWSLRKDRLGEQLYEASFYRKRRPDLYIVFVVNEFDPSRLFHLARAPEVDRVYHVHLPALLDVYDPFPNQPTISRDYLIGDSEIAKRYQIYQNLKRDIRDLSELFSDIKRVKPGPSNQTCADAEI